MTESLGRLPEGMLSNQIIKCYIGVESYLLNMWDVFTPATLEESTNSLEETRERSTQALFQLDKTTADKIRSMEKSGLEAVRDFWTQQLGGHTLTSAQEAFGEGRLGQINQRLEEFNKLPEPPK